MKQSDFYVTGMPLSQFILGAETLGMDARSVLLNFGLSEEHLLPSARVPEAQYEMVLLQLSLTSQNDCLGVDIGQQLMPSLYGVLTSMLLNSPSIGEGLKNFVEYQALASGNCGGIRYSESAAGADLSMVMTHRNTVARRLVAECVVTLLCNLLRLMSGKRGLAPDYIHMEHDPLSERSRRHLESVVKCPVKWGQESTSMFIGADICQMPLYGQGESMLQLARQVAREQLESFEKRSIQVEAIKWHARELMLSGTPRREIIATRLGISPSTLDRRLKEAELGWQELIDSLRAQLSVEYLSDLTLTIADIAAKLGFADLRAFQRRFKKWTGMTPSDFRKNAKH